MAIRRSKWLLISIHAPHEGERQRLSLHAPMTPNFNPRSPRGGATIPAIGEISLNRISIHAPHEGERLLLAIAFNICRKISIHAPHEGERQPLVTADRAKGVYFNPRSPRGGATATATPAPNRYKISIHAPHEGERRLERRRPDSVQDNFNPRSPRGGATGAGWSIPGAPDTFQSTLPTRGSDSSA